MRESRVKDGGMSIIMRMWTISSLGALLTYARIRVVGFKLFKPPKYYYMYELMVNGF
jgi:hypothetical protein